MLASLILCTKNGGERLATCLSHIESLDPESNFEFILVDNGSDDGHSFELAQEFARTSRHAVRVVQCLRPGNSAGRNDGIRVAHGEILLFIDDDCYVAPDFVDQWRQVFARYDIGYGTGMVRRHDPAMSMNGCRESPTIEHIMAKALVEPGFLQGSNMAFRRDCIDRIGLFDERFGTGVPFAGEDWDMALRASFAGFSGGYFPGPEVSHDHRRPESEITATRLHFYIYGSGAVYAKHMYSRHFFRVSVRFIRHVAHFLCDRKYNGRELLPNLLKGWRDFYRLKLRNIAHAPTTAITG